MRVCGFLPLVLMMSVSAARADDEYGEILADALKIQRTRLPGSSPDTSYHRAYERLAEAALAQPRRWEAFSLRGENRCDVAILCRGILASTLNDLRARGAPAEEIRAKEEGGAQYIQDRVEEAIRDFQIMERNMHALGQLDPRAISFASACIKYARAEFRAAKDGAPGAIEDLKSLHARGWAQKACAELIAKCYLEVGAGAFNDGEFATSQIHWDEGLKWAQTGETRRILLTNKAGAFEVDNEFGLAEKLLRDQIAAEPHVPAHWKNLGLVLGFENRLRAALHAYGEARRLCLEQSAHFPLALLHGNAWLKAAMIHGKLLEEDGDLLAGWRLFLEYRSMNGDDYNFSLNFGDFAFHLGAYDLAWTYLSHARDLHPFCPNAHQLLLQVTPRTKGSAQEIRTRIEKVQGDLQIARERYLPRLEAPALKRLCGGLRDAGDDGVAPRNMGLLEPDPLAGFGPDELPPWIVEAAAKRQPFRPYDAEIDDTTESRLPTPLPAAEEGERSRPLRSVAVGAALVAGTLFMVFLLLRRRRVAAA